MTRRHDALTHAHDDLSAALVAFSAAETRMMDARAALPGAACYDGSGGRGRSPGSTVERLATSVDPTARDRRQLDQSLRALLIHAREIRRLVDAWNPRPATDKERREVAHVNDVKPSCVHCTERRLEIRKEVEHAQNGPSDVGGLLPSPLVLCRWCKDVVRQVQRLPSEREIDRHANRQRLRIEATS